MGKTTAREQNVNFSDVYYNLTDVIIVRKDEDRIRGKADLKGIVVGAQMATSSETVLDGLAGLVGEAKKYNYTTEAFLDLKHKRIDAVVCGIAYAIVQMKKDSSFKIIGAPLNSTEIVMALPKDADDLTAQINSALAKVKTKGLYKEIYDKWLNVNQ
jgi:polar amino acid transport system substrate-binding protein